MVDERVEDGGHEEVRDATSCVTEAGNERVRCSHDVLVEKAGRPYLTGDETTAQNSHKEADRHQLADIVGRAGEEGWDGADEETATERVPGTVSVAGGTGH